MKFSFKEFYQKMQAFHKDSYGNNFFTTGSKQTAKVIDVANFT
jgi:hypothetical protein